MKKYNLLMLGAILSTTNLSATPEFAREYSANCATCHTMIPMLNETGKNFLRDGFRFSKEDTPSIKKLFQPKDGEKRHIPFAIMLNANYDDQNEKVQEKVKLYAGGTLSENLSFFGVTKDTFNGKNDNNKNDFFDETTSRAYLQLNLKGNEHLFRAGIISPLNQFGNVIKATSDSGLKGHNSNQGNQGGGNNNSHSSNKYGNSSSRGAGNNGNQNSANRGNMNYMTPLQNASISNIKGAEYSYLANNKLMFLLSYGESVEKGNSENSHNNSNSNNNNRTNNSSSDDDYLLVGGVNYKTDSGYSIGFVYNKYEKNGIDNESALIPIQKQFDKVGIVSTLVYKDETQQEDSYYGIENSITYSINEDSYLRGIVNLDKQDSDNNYGASLTYSQMYKYLLFHITGARKITEDDNENIFLGSVSLFF